MAQGTKAENTAVNRLIELAQGKPLEDGGFDDLFVDATARAAREAAKRAAAAPAPVAGKPALPPPFRPTGAMPAPMPSGRVPSSTKTNLQAAPPAPAPPAPSDEIATRPFDMVDEIDVEVAPIEVVTAVVAPLPRPAPPLPPLPPPAADEESWFEASRAVEQVDDFNATDDVPRVRRSGQAVWLFIAAAFALGLAVAALLFWPGDSKAPAGSKPASAQAAPVPAAAQPAPAPAPAPAVAPAPAPVATVQELAPAQPEVQPLPEPAPAVAPSTDITLTFESSPPGATVMLVDGTEMIPLGPAPVDYTVAAGKRYEAVFSLPGHASTIVPVEPALGSRVAATLASARAGVGASAETAVAKAEPSVASKDVPRASRRDRARNDRKDKREPKREAKAEAPGKAPAAGKGVLMLASKPPCDIVIDGKKTGKVTPQRSIALPAGKHSITLVNREHGIKESFSVTVKAGSSVKVVKDLTKRMK